MSNERSPRESCWMTTGTSMAGSFRKYATVRLHISGEVREGVVEHVEEAERIVFTWGDSMVEWRLDDHPDGTRFSVIEHRFVDDGVVWGPRLQAMASATCLA